MLANAKHILCIRFAVESTEKNENSNAIEKKKYNIEFIRNQVIFLDASIYR